MSGIQRVGDLEITQDHAFQRRLWTVQRASWAVMAGIVLAALLGLFGPGPLSRATVGDAAAPLRVEYHRFGRLKSPTTLTVHLRPRADRGDSARLWLSRDYLEGVQIERVEPVPDRVEVGPQRSAYVFRLTDGDGPTSITFHLKPEQVGPLAARMSRDGDPPLGFTQFIYP